MQYAHIIHQTYVDEIGNKDNDWEWSSKNMQKKMPEIPMTRVYFQLF